MHDTALRIGALAIETYAAGSTVEILEVGAADVNGSLRRLAPAGSTYVGVDFDAGPGIDIVVAPGSAIPVADDRFDLAIASSVLEHDPAFWTTFLDICRTVRPGGYVYINAPSNGAMHRFPTDNWRFYPDAGQALAQWATSQGLDISLVESFIAERNEDIWNDFVAVFRKGGSDTPLPETLLNDQVPSTNVRIGDDPAIHRVSDETQDMRLLGEAHALLDETRAALADKDAWIFRLSAERQVAEKAASNASAAQADAERELDRMRRAIDRLEESNRLTLAKSDAKLADTLTELGEALSMVEEVRTALAVEQQAAERKLAERFTESAMLTRLLVDQEDLREIQEYRVDWLRQIGDEAITRPWWWNLLPPAVRRRRINRRLRRRGLFDGPAYLGRYPDVAAAGMDPLRHYILHGMIEGRHLPQ